MQRQYLWIMQANIYPGDEEIDLGATGTEIGERMYGGVVAGGISGISRVVFQGPEIDAGLPEALTRLRYRVAHRG